MLMKSPFLLLPLRPLATGAACLLLAASAFAQTPAPGAPAAPGAAAPGAAPGAPAPGAAPAATPAPPLGPFEKNFVKSAAKSLFYLSQLGNAAKTATLDPTQTRFRDTLIKDMTKAFEALSKLAETHGDKVAAGELTGGDKSDVERLAKLKDEKFTKQWVEFVQKESKRLDKDFEQAAKSSQNVDFKMYLVNYGPGVRNVFTTSEAVQKGLQTKKK
jgi:hypothetical protein